MESQTGKGLIAGPGPPDPEPSSPILKHKRSVQIIKRKHGTNRWDKPITNQLQTFQNPSKVEHIFGAFTAWMNHALHLKAIGLQRIESLIGLANLTYNLVRYEQLVRLKGVKVI